MLKKHSIKKHIIIISCLLIIWITYGVCGISCPVRYILGIACPTCGVTRAMIALLRGNFEGYLYYNPMALVLLSDVWVAIHVKFFKRFRVIMWIYLVATLTLNLIIYFVRVLNNFQI